MSDARSLRGVEDRLGHESHAVQVDITLKLSSSDGSLAAAVSALTHDLEGSGV